MKTSPVNLICHRGMSIYKVPENTLPALRMALEKGFMIETDVQRVKDGYVLHHDKTIPRADEKNQIDRLSKFETQYGSGFYLPSGGKPISECTLDELLTQARFDKEWHEAALSKHAGKKVCLHLTEEPKIATLGDLLLLLKQFPKSRAFLEIKRQDINVDYNDGMEEEIIGMLKDLGLINNVIINTSSISSLKHVRRVSSDIAISIDTDYIPDHPDLAHDVQEAIKLKEQIGLNFWNPPFFQVDKKLLDDFERTGLEIAAWAQFEKPEEELSEIKRLAAIGLKYMFTDQAEEAKKLLGI